MEHFAILNDLGWLMVAAGVASVIFRRVKQPAILGYLLVGLLLGKHLLPFSPVNELENVRELSELGVVFLMFYIGLEFDLGKLQPVAGAAMLALIIQTIAMVMLGTTAAQALGWTAVEGLFLGGILSISSSMVTFKLIGERGDLGRRYAQYTAGVLILEDILAIILLVVLSGVAVTGHLEVETVGRTTFFVGMFVVAVFVVGKLAAPVALRMLHKFGNNETITLFTVALILAVSLLAARFNFSLALGGFMSGAILSKSSLAEEIEDLTAPLRDFFSALFFVSVGTLINPGRVLEHWSTILIITALVIFGKFVTCWLGFVIGSVPPRVATRASLAKVQIGEFAFIIAALGLRLGVTNPSLEAIATGVAVLTILVTPLAVASREWIINSSARTTPKPMIHGLRLYQGWSEAIRLSLQSNPFLKTAKRPFTHIVVYFLLLNALVILASFAAENLPFSDDPAWRTHSQQLVWVAVALISIPVQVAVLRNINAVTMILAEVSLSWSVLRPLAKGPLRELVRWGMFAAVFFVYAAIFLIACSRYFPTGLTLVVFVAVFIVFALFFWRRAVRLQSIVEFSLQEAMREHGGSVVKASVEEAIQRISRRNPWPVHPTEVEIPKNGAVVGKKIRDLDLRRTTGATIAAVRRGGVVHYDVTPDFPLSPLDCLVIVGDSNQVTQAERQLRDVAASSTETKPHTFEKLLVTAVSDFCGLPLRDSKIRATFNVTVLGIQRGDQRITGPGPDEILRDGDLLLVMGQPEDTARLNDALTGEDYELPASGA